MHWYRSKVDWWLVPLLCIPPVASVAVTVMVLRVGTPAEAFVGFGMILLVVAIYVGLVFPMKYGMDDEHLHVRFGLCHRRIPLARITNVWPTNNPLSSPALSLDRLHVQFGSGLWGALMISPADREQFLDELARRAGLRREGGRLHRAAS